MPCWDFLLEWPSSLLFAHPHPRDTSNHEWIMLECQFLFRRSKVEYEILLWCIAGGTHHTLNNKDLDNCSLGSRKHWFLARAYWKGQKRKLYTIKYLISDWIRLRTRQTLSILQKLYNSMWSINNYVHIYHKIVYTVCKEISPRIKLKLLKQLSSVFMLHKT